MVSLPGRKVNDARAKMVLENPLGFSRREMLDELESSVYDVVIVGGGITGSYAALDAASRGFKVALIEKDDFASGTSSKSSKMVHGGLRYIEQGNLPLVRHSLLERQRLRNNAPHLIQRLPFLFPVLTDNGVFDPRLAAGFEALLWTYDLAGGWREGVLHQKLAPNEVLSHCPTFKAERLKYGFMYYDARVDDARLTLTVARTAAYFGATVLNHAKVTDIRRDNGKISGVEVETSEGRSVSVRSKSVVMATGSWLRDWHGAHPDADVPPIRPAKGVHIAVPWSKIRNDCTVTIPVPGRSRRATITRWGDIALLGTTDDDYQGDLDNVYCTADERDFLISGTRTALNTDLDADDVLGSIAGTRPLTATPGGKSVDVKRNHEIRIDADGLVTVVGGKLTTSRHMAEQTIDAVARVLGSKARTRTVKQPLLGGAGYDAQSTTATGGLVAHLGERYGNESHFVADIIEHEAGASAPLVEGLPYRTGEAVYAIRREMATTISDVLDRRMRARLHARDASAAAAPAVADLLVAEGVTDRAGADAQLADYLTGIEAEKTALNTYVNDKEYA
ncbi:glycerol-3-phosphate dehydrogenase/oxidase [Brevibacterium sp. 91QC2O2]|uniref:glycerol-3-phosphate dehydrogenase/oxidase n=1 Tax=Brevibacterium sp. 91QC2O2 TaxID=2968458 RepID=UPI00211B7C2A|nr:glycerol-3-phosphate dehydrogenase/oxidase [Brevibacterium sp. 91QC2O2]MCQ9367093.1 glycerol-3-phosphate dehydrogenase/oxidase [Brevibacterium sp. 91QC2O2]